MAILWKADFNAEAFCGQIFTKSRQVSTLNPSHSRIGAHSAGIVPTLLGRICRTVQSIRFRYGSSIINRQPLLLAWRSVWPGSKLPPPLSLQRSRSQIITSQVPLSRICLKPNLVPPTMPIFAELGAAELGATHHADLCATHSVVATSRESNSKKGVSRGGAGHAEEWQNCDLCFSVFSAAPRENCTNRC